MAAKKLSKTKSTVEKNRITCLLVSLALCSTSFAHYILNPLGLSQANMLAVSLVITVGSAFPLLLQLSDSKKKAKIT